MESFEVAVIELGVLADPVSELFEVNLSGAAVNLTASKDIGSESPD